jgi:PhnB protein
MSFHPYLMFGGNCREAFTQYQKIFGGELTLLSLADAPTGQEVPPDQSDLIMHAALVIGDDLLMASDETPGEYHGMRDAWVNYACRDVAEAERVFSELANGGTVNLAISETFWSPAFGMCVDRFGVQWMVNAQAPERAEPDRSAPSSAE